MNRSHPAFRKSVPIRAARRKSQTLHAPCCQGLAELSAVGIASNLGREPGRDAGQRPPPNPLVLTFHPARGPTRGQVTRGQERGASCPEAPSLTSPPQSRHRSRTRLPQGLPRARSRHAYRVPECPPARTSQLVRFHRDCFHVTPDMRPRICLMPRHSWQRQEKSDRVYRLA